MELPSVSRFPLPPTALQNLNEKKTEKEETHQENQKKQIKEENKMQENENKDKTEIIDKSSNNTPTEQKNLKKQSQKSNSPPSVISKPLLVATSNATFISTPTEINKIEETSSEIKLSVLMVCPELRTQNSYSHFCNVMIKNILKSNIRKSEIDSIEFLIFCPSDTEILDQVNRILEWKQQKQHQEQEQKDFDQMPIVPKIRFFTSSSTQINSKQEDYQKFNSLALVAKGTFLFFLRNFNFLHPEEITFVLDLFRRYNDGSEVSMYIYLLSCATFPLTENRYVIPTNLFLEFKGWCEGDLVFFQQLVQKHSEISLICYRNQCPQWLKTIFHEKRIEIPFDFIVRLPTYSFGMEQIEKQRKEKENGIEEEEEEEEEKEKEEERKRREQAHQNKTKKKLLEEINSSDVFFFIPKKNAAIHQHASRHWVRSFNEYHDLQFIKERQEQHQQQLFSSSSPSSSFSSSLFKTTARNRFNNAQLIKNRFHFDQWESALPQNLLSLNKTQVPSSEILSNLKKSKKQTEKKELKKTNFQKSVGTKIATLSLLSQREEDKLKKTFQGMKNQISRLLLSFSNGNQKGDRKLNLEGEESRTQTSVLQTNPNSNEMLWIILAIVFVVLGVAAILVPILISSEKKKRSKQKIKLQQEAPQATPVPSIGPNSSVQKISSF